MNTKLLMTSSAVVLGITGLVLSFAPEEILAYYGEPGGAGKLAFQLLGATYFGFAMLNWMGKGNLIGGIYSKPVSTANLAHFTIGGLALIKLAMANSAETILWASAGVYVLFALLFARVSFTHPEKSAA
ncbi:MAG TPA: hypothetical protein VGD90_01795 [Sphingobacteriaceae bacterium]